MHFQFWFTAVCFVCVSNTFANAQEMNSCDTLKNFKAPKVEITKAVSVAAGTTEPIPWNQERTAPLPAYCRVEGVINQRAGVGGEEFGIRFALAMPDKWNGDFLMQGGAGSNGVVMAPLGLNAAGDEPALIRGFAVVSTNSGHTSHHPGFDFAFRRDQQAYLDFAYLANAEVAELAKQIIAQHYGKAPSYSYFSGCSTGGREGMILSQRYPTIFDGIISGDPAMRTGLSNLAIGQWIPVAFNQIAPKDSAGKPIITDAITDGDRNLIAEALLKRCDAKDGVADGLISDPLGCDFDLAVLTCKEGKTVSCLSAEKASAIKKVMGGPKTREGLQIYPGFLYDTGITAGAPFRGILSPGPGVFGPATTAMEFAVEKEAMANIQPLVDSMSTDLTTFAGHGGKLIFYHGVSDAWFSPLDTFEYFKRMADANGGLDIASKWSQFYFVPGMTHCGGGRSLDNFDLLTAMVNWVEKGTAPESVTATGKAFPGRSRPLCAYPKHAQYKGQGNTEDAANFECR
jgi:tannase/feruloyl esterase